MKIFLQKLSNFFTQRNWAYTVSATFSIIWSILIIISVTLAAIYLPLRLIDNIDHRIFSDRLALGVTLFFVADIFYNFYRAAYPLLNSPFDRTTRIRSYIKRRLWIDTLAALPMHYFFGAHPLILLRMVKLIRVRDIMNRWQRLTVRYGSVLRLVFLGYWLLIIAHWVACGWIGLHGAPEGVPFRTYYVKSLYWAVTTLSTVGYGDVTPNTDEEKFYAMFVMILGVIMVGYIVGNITNLLNNLDLTQKHYYEQSEQIRAFMQYHKIPTQMQRRISDNVIKLSPSSSYEAVLRVYL